jgi:hypothetical protein
VVAMADEWTVDILHAHILAILDEREKRNDQRFTDMQTALQAALAASEKAVIKAEVATEKRFEGVNEFRSMVNDLVAGKIDRAEFMLAIASLRERYDDLNDRVTRSEGKGSGKDALWAYIVGAIGVLAAVVAVVSRF